MPRAVGNAKFFVHVIFGQRSPAPHQNCREPSNAFNAESIPVGVPAKRLPHGRVATCALACQPWPSFISTSPRGRTHVVVWFIRLVTRKLAAVPKRRCVAPEPTDPRATCAIRGITGLLGRVGIAGLPGSSSALFNAYLARWQPFAGEGRAGPSLRAELPGHQELAAALRPHVVHESRSR